MDKKMNETFTRDEIEEILMRKTKELPEEQQFWNLDEKTQHKILGEYLQKYKEENNIKY